MSSFILEDILEPVKEDLNQLNQNLINKVGLENPFIEKITKHIVGAGGKRLRPAIVFFVAKTFNNGIVTPDHYRLAESIELIHTATLIHDDVVDNADTRRSVPTVNKIWNEKTAVIAGDYLLSKALIVLSEIQNNKLMMEFASSMKEICVGEIQQNLQAQKMITIEEYIEKSKRKTAILFALAAKSAAMITGDVDGKQIQQTQEYGLNFGIAFQIVDDILNFKPEEDKPVLNDIANGVVTAPVIYASQNNSELLSLLEKEDLSVDDLTFIFNIVNSSEGINKTIELAEDFINKARKSIDSFPDNIYKKSLTDLLDLCLKISNRKSF